MAPSDKDFLDISDHSADHLWRLFTVARELKDGTWDGRPLEGKTLAMIFRKSSTRTRVSFEAGMTQLGGHALFLSDRDSQMGRGESVRDTAGVLSGYVEGIMIRTFGHDEVVELAGHARVPVINGLTDLLHPCQVMADVMTMVEEFGDDLSSLRVAWVGDGNNMANSWMNAAYRLGFSLRLACPAGYDPDPAILARARGAADVEVVREPAEAIAGAHVVTTDVWASMGQEGEQAERERAFSDFCVDGELMNRADGASIFLHCLPAHRGEEVTADVIDGPRSRIFQEAENRLHIQKAILLELMG
ncbi:MAG: ornithine carbamoyltransferase [Gemmatimonadota bacterium]|nr:ornithine carbamoyltransferase [Gemmatimonadota bacterium]